MTKAYPFVKTIILVVMVFSLFNSACKKKEIQGPIGEPGASGGGSNSSISASQIFNILASQWNKNADSTAWITTINSDLITKDVAEKGAVKLFVLKGSSWWELPYNEGDLFMQFSFKEGSATIRYADIHASLPDEPGGAQYRLVAVSEIK